MDLVRIHPIWSLPGPLPRSLLLRVQLPIDLASLSLVPLGRLRVQLPELGSLEIPNLLT